MIVLKHTDTGMSLDSLVPRPSIKVWEKRRPGLHCNSVSAHALAITRKSGNRIFRL